MADGQDPDDVSRCDEAIERDVSGLPIRDDELPKPLFDRTAEMRMFR